jgi:hypothetical protein
MRARIALLCGLIIGTCATALLLRRGHAECRAALQREILISERALTEERAWCRHWRERAKRAEGRRP